MSDHFSFASFTEMFSISMPNGYSLNFRPVKDDPTKIEMRVVGNGSDVRHTCMNAEEMALQIQTFAQKRVE